MSTDKGIGENLRRARKKRKLTQAELAQLAGINSNYYAKIERGKANPSTEILKKIIEALKIKSSDILPF
jgi:transcriptional regulator with XRE-family HTH domain